MRHPRPLRPATLVRRYKRFLADVELADGTRLTVHCPNSGRMTACSEPGRPVLISTSDDPRRKLRHTLELIHMGDAWVGVHSAAANRTVEALVGTGGIPELAGYDEIRREVRYGPDGRSRVDLLLTATGRRPCYVEVKSSTLRDAAGFAAFPDAVSDRGRKHLEDLIHVVGSGHRGVLFLFVGRADCDHFRPADEIDPAYGATFRHALAAGVEVLAYRMRFSPEGVEVAGRLPVVCDRDASRSSSVSGGVP